MIKAYFLQKRFHPEIVTISNQNTLQDALWIDLFCPTKEEETLVEKFLNFNIPTREEMQEIELSSRLYSINNALVMTATMVANSNTDEPKSDAVTLILAKGKLITLRYIEPQAFVLLSSRFQKLTLKSDHALHLMIELLDAIIDRLADMLEQIRHQIDEYSQIIFRPQKSKKPSSAPNYKRLLQDIGANGDLNTKAEESLVTVNRLIAFFERSASLNQYPQVASRVPTLTEDIKSLSNYATFLSNKIGFLLDATLGMVNIDQNNIIKIFSIAAVILLPPTLIASIYGMNFRYMPELSWYWGYPFAIGLMGLSAWLPYKYFKRRKLL